LDRLFVSSDDLALGTRSIFQKISIDGETPLEELAGKHGVKIQREQKKLTVAEFFTETRGEELKTGDRITLNSDALIARTIEDGKLVKADLLVESVSEGREDIGVIKTISAFLRKE